MINIILYPIQIIYDDIFNSISVSKLLNELYRKKKLIYILLAITTPPVKTKKKVFKQKINVFWCSF